MTMDTVTVNSAMAKLDRMAFLESISTNSETVEALEEAINGENMIGSFNSVKDAFDFMDSRGDDNAKG